MRFIERLKLCWRILRFKQSNMLDHAASELPKPEDEMQAMMNSNLFELVLVFATQEHSGFSASYAISALEKILRFEPLGPLTGEDDEWVEVDFGPDMKWQNKRCGHVFKNADGTAYDSEARIFRDPDGCCFTSRDSRVEVTFPYTPAREYVDVAA